MCLKPVKSRESTNTRIPIPAFIFCTIYKQRLYFLKLFPLLYTLPLWILFQNIVHTNSSTVFLQIVSAKTFFFESVKCGNFHIGSSRIMAIFYFINWIYAAETIKGGETKVSLLGVDSLWGDCKFIPADWGS